MPRFFTEEVYINDSAPDRISLKGDNAYHLVRVLRARPGEKVTVVAGDGREYTCSFLSSSGEGKSLSAILQVLSAEEAPQKPCRVTLIQGMPKGKKTDLVLQKATELGADRIALVYMDRSIPVLDDDGEGKLVRFRRIVSEAAAQCGRSTVPNVTLLQDLASALPMLSDNEIAFACYEAERERRLPDFLRSEISSVGFLVGPEGGLSPREIGLLADNGIPTVSLGHRILRTETAPLAVLSMIIYETELKNDR